MKYGFGHRSAADHIHVDDRPDALRELRLGVQQRQRAFDFRRPDEANRTRRLGEFSFDDQFLQRASNLQNRHAAAGVVVRAGTLVIEVAAEGNLLVVELRIGAGNRRGHHFGVAGMLPGFYDRVQLDLLAVTEPFAQHPRRLQRNHEAERFIGRKCFQVAPAN